MLQLLLPIVTGLITALVTLIGFWIKTNIDKADNARITREAAEGVSRTAMATAAALAESTAGARDKVLGKIEESHQVSYAAIDKANHMNEKIYNTNEEILKIANAQAALTAAAISPAVQDVRIVADEPVPVVVKEKP